MARRRFRWTRERYRKAHSLARFLARWPYDFNSDPPPLVQRFFDLYEKHPQREDRLSLPLRQRAAAFLDSIPF
jgi:hypothetical protein